MKYADLAEMRAHVLATLQDRGEYMPPTTWQSRDVSHIKSAATIETQNVMFTVQNLPTTLMDLQGDLKPNIPWADEHFRERVSGQPLNPPPSWVRWPWANKAAESLVEEKFSHSYPERLWPRYAPWGGENNSGVPHDGKWGVRYRWGDLNDVVNLIDGQPDTRQAFVPIWFPEDTGVVHGERVPCTIGYHFLVRDGRLHCTYLIRSCDLVRHFDDDIYLTVRLQMWMMLRLFDRDDRWRKLRLGTLSVWIGSLHLFINDYYALFGKPFDRTRIPEEYR